MNSQLKNYFLCILEGNSKNKNPLLKNMSSPKLKLWLYMLKRTGKINQEQSRNVLLPTHFRQRIQSKTELPSRPKSSNKFHKITDKKAIKKNKKSHLRLGKNKLQLM